MDVYLIRHAHAGDRQNDSHDRYRQLNEKGRSRAAELETDFTGIEISRVLASPATRCVQTVEPLARDHGLVVEEHPDLFEGSRIDDVLKLLADPAPGAVVACSHGDIIPEVIEAVLRAGAAVRGRGFERGGVWHLIHNGRAWTSASRFSTS